MDGRAGTLDEDVDRSKDQAMMVDWEAVNITCGKTALGRVTKQCGTGAVDKGTIGNLKKRILAALGRPTPKFHGDVIWQRNAEITSRHTMDHEHPCAMTVAE